MLDVQRVRKDFPILSRVIHGKPLIYLDSAATSQKPTSVIDALSQAYRLHNANVHRAVYVIAEEATAAYEKSRERVAKFIGAPNAKCVIFTRNATEAVNLVAQTWARANIDSGDEMILSDLEHHSNLVPWIRLCQEKGILLRIWKSDKEGVLHLKDLKEIFSLRTKFLAITQMSNVLGTITPIEDIIEAAHKQKITVLVDGAQGAPHLPTDVAVMKCDFYVCSAHKMLGPTGIGVLYGREELLRNMEPFLSGGEMIREVSYDKVTWNDLPWKFEAGTPNFADGAAFGASIEYLEHLGMKHVRAHEIELTTYALAQFAKLGDIVTLYGPRDVAQRGGVVSFNVEGVHPHDVGTALDLEGIAIRAGHHCAQPTMKKLGVPATARASFYVYNTEEEVDRLVEAVKKTHAFFGRDHVRS